MAEYDCYRERPRGCVMDAIFWKPRTGERVGMIYSRNYAVR